MKRALVIPLVLLAAGCTVADTFVRPDGGRDHIIGCGVAVSWHVCYGRANELCPGGYAVTRESLASIGKELRIACADERHYARGR